MKIKPLIYCTQNLGLLSILVIFYPVIIPVNTVILGCSREPPVGKIKFLKLFILYVLKGFYYALQQTMCKKCGLKLSPYNE